eukprot:scaffold7120_cov60-Attheya_sp.AAC.4
MSSVAAARSKQWCISVVAANNLWGCVADYLSISTQPKYLLPYINACGSHPTLQHIHLGVFARYWCDILCDSSVETSSPLVDTQIRCSISPPQESPRRTILIHGDRNALFAMVASHLLRSISGPSHSSALGLINSVNVTVVAHKQALHYTSSR